MMLCTGHERRARGGGGGVGWMKVDGGGWRWMEVARMMVGLL